MKNASRRGSRDCKPLYETPVTGVTNSFKLIAHTIGNFNILPDKLAVARINESLSTLQQARELRLREAEGALKSQYPSSCNGKSYS